MIHALVEGYVDGCLLTALFRQIGQGHRKLVVHDARGASNFWKSAERYNAAARHKVMVGLADLEQAACVPAQLSTLKGGVSPNFKLRLAERMLESWIMADRAAFAAFLGVAPARLPLEPDAEPHPKKLVASLARTSKKRSIREGLAPAHQGALVGPEYTPMMAGFIDAHWDSARARPFSPSLERACESWSKV